MSMQNDNDGQSQPVETHFHFVCLYFDTKWYIPASHSKHDTWKYISQTGQFTLCG